MTRCPSVSCTQPDCGNLHEDSRIRVIGKQIKFDGNHLADCSSPESAVVIATALEFMTVMGTPEHLRVKIEEFFV